MTTTSPPIIGIFNNNATAEHAIKDLNNAGYSANEIHYSGAAGKGIGNLKSWVTGEEPAPAEEIARDLKTMGVPTESANYCANEYKAGHPIVAVQSTGHEQETIKIVRNNGGQAYGPAGGSTTRDQYGRTSGTGMARDQQTRAASSTASMGTTQDRSTRTGTTRDQTTRAANASQATSSAPGRTTDYNVRGTEQEEMHIPLREEQLHAEKQAVQTGEVVVHKDIITEQKNIDVPVSREELVIERHHVSGARPTDRQVGQDDMQDIRIPLYEEQVTISKDTMETGDVSIGKRTVNEQRHFSDKVRHEDVRVEKTGDARVHDENIDDDLPKKR